MIGGHDLGKDYQPYQWNASLEVLPDLCSNLSRAVVRRKNFYHEIGNQLAKRRRRFPVWQFGAAHKHHIWRADISIRQDNAGIRRVNASEIVGLDEFENSGSDLESHR